LREEIDFPLPSGERKKGEGVRMDSLLENSSNTTVETKRLGMVPSLRMFYSLSL